MGVSSARSLAKWNWGGSQNLIEAKEDEQGEKNVFETAKNKEDFVRGEGKRRAFTNSNEIPINQKRGVKSRWVIRWFGIRGERSSRQERKNPRRLQASASNSGKVNRVHNSNGKGLSKKQKSNSS